MKLLFDQNLSPSLVTRLSDLYPFATHVAHVELDTADDRTIWDYARANGYMIVSKDADFSEISLLHGFPPKVILVQRGNCSTQAIEQILRNNYSTVETLFLDSSSGIVLLS